MGRHRFIIYHLSACSIIAADPNTTRITVFRAEPRLIRFAVPRRYFAKSATRVVMSRYERVNMLHAPPPSSSLMEETTTKFRVRYGQIRSSCVGQCVESGENTAPQLVTRCGSYERLSGQPRLYPMTRRCCSRNHKTSSPN